MVMLHKVCRTAAIIVYAVTILAAAPAMVWAQGGGGSTPFPHSAGSRAAEELNQPHSPTVRTEKPKPHRPRLAPRAQARGQQAMPAPGTPQNR
jgi:hypothetical protein